MTQRDGVYSEASWSEADSAVEAGGGTLGKRLAAVTLVEAGPGSGVYSLTGSIRYRVDRDAGTVTILEYAGEGTHVSGEDLGAIGYRAVEPLTSVLRPDRTFVADGRVAWSDASTVASTLPVTLRGTLLETGEVAFLSTTFAGSGSADLAEVSVQIPACW